MQIVRGAVRGVVVVSFVIALAVPAEAKLSRPSEDRSWERFFDREPIVKIVKILKKFNPRSWGDGLIDPRP